MEELRAKMVKSYEESRLSPETIKLSQELDEVMVEEMKKQLGHRPK
ncbi:aspartyl-phosphate phosphatase Spo0E family protein [Clostridium beijerinckii]|nr:aspartyl-phosphate phosphatase Spo0E family protein [Clostridium beijerinckii]